LDKISLGLAGNLAAMILCYGLKPLEKPALIGELFIQDKLSWTKFHPDWLETWRP